MASRANITALEARNQQLTESLSNTRQRLAEITGYLNRLTKDVEQYARPQSYSTRLGYTSPFPSNAILHSLNLNRSATMRTHSPDLLSNLFVDSDNNQSQTDNRHETQAPTHFWASQSPTTARACLQNEGSSQPCALPTGNPSDACADIVHHEGIVRHIMMQEFTEDPSNCQSLDSLIARMLQSLLSSQKWERLAYFCIATSSWDRLGPITRWRIEPTVEHYIQLSPCWRPTYLQLTRLHWPIVDWVPYPKIRDELILHQEKYDLNEVCAELNTSFCMEMNFIDAFPDLESGGDQIVSSVGLGVSATSRFPGDPHVGIANVAGRSANAPLRTRGVPKRPDVVYVHIQEYVDYNTRPDSIASGQQMNENVLTHLLIAFRQQENQFKLHPKFFDQFPDLPAHLYMVKGEEISIFGGWQQCGD